MWRVEFCKKYLNGGKEKCCQAKSGRLSVTQDRQRREKDKDTRIALKAEA